MKLIGDNAGRRIIAFSSPTQGVDAQQNVNTQTPIILDNQGGAVQAGQPTWNQGEGFFLGFLNGIPVFSIGNSDQGMTWDGTTLNIIGVLEAISAIISGSVQIGEGGEIFSGQTDFATGTGFWLGTDSSGNPQFSLLDQFGNYVFFDGSSSNPLSISSSALVNALSSLQTDDAGWSQTALWGLIASLPTTLAGFGITDAQPALPTSTALAQGLFSDNGGFPYWRNQYDTNVNFGSATLTNTSSSSNSFIQWGAIMGCPNPGQAVNLHAWVSGFINSAGTAIGTAEVEYSLDGGSTWTAGPAIGGGVTATTLDVPIYAEVFAQGVTPSNDIQFRALCKANSGSAAFDNGTLSFELLPVSSFYVIQPLAASVPGTASMNCSAAYPTTSCTATGTVKATPTGGLGPFTYSWTKVSGTGFIASGSTSQTVTLGDTETTADGGATHATTVNCTVQDSQTYTPTAGSDAANVATVTIGTHNIPVGAIVNISGCTPAAYNVTSATVTAITGTAIKYATASTPGAMTVFGTVNAVRVTTGNCVMTGTFTRTYNAIVPSVAAAIGTCHATVCPNTCTATTTMTANATGGNGSYTYAWSVFSGSATIASGSSSQTVHLTQTAGTAPSPPPVSQNSTIECSVNDSRGTGAKNASNTCTFQFTCPIS